MKTCAEADCTKQAAYQNNTDNRALCVQHTGMELVRMASKAGTTKLQPVQLAFTKIENLS